ncbi:MAG: hypothetical protein LBN03_02125 [Bifidobacteriaceae bacterium]|jgi:membrane-associated HD superfamily phosphohydrolase|nr:hypothetical protein [Bifidobacteriaceae bacterium]
MKNTNTATYKNLVFDSLLIAGIIISFSFSIICTAKIESIPKENSPETVAFKQEITSKAYQTISDEPDLRKTDKKQALIQAQQLINTETSKFIETNQLIRDHYVKMQLISLIISLYFVLLIVYTVRKNRSLLKKRKTSKMRKRQA